MDIAFQFNLAIVTYGRLNSSRSIIIQSYARKRLSFDIVSILSIVIPEFNIESKRNFQYAIAWRVIRPLLSLFKIPTLLNYCQIIDQKTQISEKFRRQLQISTVFICTLYIFHFWACLWHLAGQYHILANNPQN